MATLSEWKRKLRRLGFPETQRAERRTPTGFTARHGNSPGSRPAIIQNISSTGLYVLTEERWPLGELASIAIQIEGAPADGTQPELSVNARVARHGEDGMGLSFVLPAGLDHNLWEALVEVTAAVTDRQRVEFMLRMVRTVLFLCRICQSEAGEAIHLLSGELDEPRIETAMQIALGAEKLLDAQPGSANLRAHSKLVAAHLRFGSWAIDDLTRQLWAGLLASSCTVEGADDSNQVYVDLLVNLAPTQSQILVGACRMATGAKPETGENAPGRVIVAREQVLQLTGLTDISRISMNLASLFNMGIIEKNFDFTSYIPPETFDITPSRLGMDLYKKCKGNLARSQPLTSDLERRPA
jgi:hypothetical protein